MQTLRMIKCFMFNMGRPTKRISNRKRFVCLQIAHKTFQCCQCVCMQEMLIHFSQQQQQNPRYLFPRALPFLNLTEHKLRFFNTMQKPHKSDMCLYPSSHIHTYTILPHSLVRPENIIFLVIFLVLIRLHSFVYITQNINPTFS